MWDTAILPTPGRDETSSVESGGGSVRISEEVGEITETHEREGAEFYDNWE
jgi:hypothetical protein